MGVIIDCKSNSSRFWNRTDSTMAYFDDIKKYSVLSKEEEKELLYIIKMVIKKRVYRQEINSFLTTKDS